MELEYAMGMQEICKQGSLSVILRPKFIELTTIDDAGIEKSRWVNTSTIRAMYNYHSGTEIAFDTYFLRVKNTVRELLEEIKNA